MNHNKKTGPSIYIPDLNLGSNLFWIPTGKRLPWGRFYMVFHSPPR